MTTQDDNKKIARRVPLEVLNQGKIDLINELFTPNYVEHSSAPSIPSNRDGMRQWFTLLRAAFPDIKYSVDEELAEGDRVVQRLTGHGTMRGPLLGFQPTGKSATWSEMHIARVQDGKVVEHWGEVDQVGMMQQLGLIPAVAPSGSSTTKSK